MKAFKQIVFNSGPQEDMLDISCLESANMFLRHHRTKNGKPKPVCLSTEFLKRCFDLVCHVQTKCVKEVPSVIGLVQVLPELLNKMCVGVPAGGGKIRRVKFSGYVIHGQPVAKFKTQHGGHGCELGDILVVSRDLLCDKQNAMLLQAKVVRNKELRHRLSDGSSLNQLDLYTSWPVFNLDKYPTASYDVTPKRRNAGAQYLLFRHWRRPTMLIAKPAIELRVGSPSLASCMMSMLKLSGGRPYSSNPNVDEWSRLIHDLIDYVQKYGTIHCGSLLKDQYLSRMSSSKIVMYLDEQIRINSPIRISGMGKDMNVLTESSSTFGVLIMDVTDEIVGERNQEREQGGMCF